MAKVDVEEEEIIEAEVMPIEKPTIKTSKKNKMAVQLLVLLIIFLSILSLFGGEVLGNWYTTAQQTDRAADGILFSSGIANYGLDAVFVSGKMNDEHVEGDKSLQMNYGDQSENIKTLCNCEETTKVMFLVKILVYINLIFGIGLIYVIRYQKFNEDMIVKLLFSIAIITLIAGIYFATALPNAINEDQGDQSIYLIQEKDPSIISMYSETTGTDRILNDFFEVTIKGQWYPNLGFLYLIGNLLFCLFALGLLNYDFSRIFGSLED